MSDLVYKLKHVPTGMYYQPTKGRWAHEKTNLSTRGKIYTTKLYPKKISAVNISKSQAEKLNVLTRESSFKELMVDTKPEDWVVETHVLTLHSSQSL
jgi:hypothetical protein